jgi:hypothetical protein
MMKRNPCSGQHLPIVGHRASGKQASIVMVEGSRSFRRMVPAPACLAAPAVGMATDRGGTGAPLEPLDPLDEPLYSDR